MCKAICQNALFTVTQKNQLLQMFVLSNLPCQMHTLMFISKDITLPTTMWKRIIKHKKKLSLILIHVMILFSFNSL